MQIFGEVKEVKYLRGGINVTITPVLSPEGTPEAFTDRPRGTIELRGLTDEAKGLQAGKLVVIDINVEVAEPAEEVPTPGIGYEPDSSGYGNDE
jgi:hypothetical protein